MMWFYNHGETTIHWRNIWKTKRSLAAEHLVNARDCARNYNKSRFIIIHHCNNVFDLVKIKVISILLEKPE